MLRAEANLWCSSALFPMGAWTHLGLYGKCFTARALFVAHFWFFETESQVIQAGHKVTLLLDAGLELQNIGIIGVHHHHHILCNYIYRPRLYKNWLGEERL